LTAAAFSKTSDCAVVNTDQVIANLSEGAKFTMRVGVKKGTGYEPVEKKADREKVVGIITIDSIYSPVVAVSYRVESTRVGQMTNFDKLLIDVHTDGSIAPSDALKHASIVLANQYQAISGGMALAEQMVVAAAHAETAEPEMAEEAPVAQVAVDPKTKVEDAGLSGRTVHALVAAGFKTLSGLMRLTDIKLQSIPGLGKKGIEELKAVLDRVQQ
jgi:DNA-directed RNA polymerase subunit alpha